MTNATTLVGNTMMAVRQVRNNCGETSPPPSVRPGRSGLGLRQKTPVERLCPAVGHRKTADEQLEGVPSVAPKPTVLSDRAAGATTAAPVP